MNKGEMKHFLMWRASFPLTEHHGQNFFAHGAQKSFVQAYTFQTDLQNFEEDEHERKAFCMIISNKVILCKNEKICF